MSAALHSEAADVGQHVAPHLGIDVAQRVVDHASRTKLTALMKTDLEVKRIGRSVKIKAQSIRDYMDRP